MKSKASAAIKFKAKEPCYGCGKECYDLPVETVLKRHKFCSRLCLHINYFKFPSLQLNHYHERTTIHTS